MAQPRELYAIRLGSDRFVAAVSTRKRAFRRLLRETGTPIEGVRRVEQWWPGVDPRLYVVASLHFDMEGRTLFFERGEEDGLYYMPAWAAGEDINRLWERYIDYTSGLTGLARVFVL